MKYLARVKLDALLVCYNEPLYKYDPEDKFYLKKKKVKQSQ